MSSIADETIKAINEKQIKPKPKWHFLLKNYTIWIFLAIFIIFGSLAICTILFVLTTQDWDVHDYLGKSFFQYVFISIPHLWIGAFAVLILLAFYSFIHTKHGYRRAISQVFLVSIGISAILGVTLFFLGVNSQIHEFCSKNIPFYNTLMYYKEDVWDNAQRGLLAGKVLDIKSKNEFTLEDFKGNIWHITGDNISWDDVRPQFGAEIKLIGHCGGGSIFYGKSIRPW